MLRKPFEAFTGLVAPLDRANVNTDVIIPKQFLKSISRQGLGPFLFDNWRYLDEGVLGQDCAERPQNPDFVLNDSRYASAEILITRENFGCGSSREHAVWALMDYGFRTIIAPSFAEIFFSNAVKNGLLTVTLDKDTVGRLIHEVEELEGYSLYVGLARQVLITPHDEQIEFEFDIEIKRRLIKGLDDIALILEHEADITEYEKRRAKEAPWLVSDNRGTV